MSLDVKVKAELNEMKKEKKNGQQHQNIQLQERLERIWRVLLFLRARYKSERINHNFHLINLSVDLLHLF